MTTFLLPSLRRPHHLLLWAVGVGVALLLAPTIAGAVILTVADARTTSFHWRLEANYGPGTTSACPACSAWTGDRMASPGTSGARPG